MSARQSSHHFWGIGLIVSSFLWSWESAAIVRAEYSEDGNIKTIAKNTLLTCFIICYLLNCGTLSLRLQHPLL